MFRLIDLQPKRILSQIFYICAFSSLSLHFVFCEILHIFLLFRKKLVCRIYILIYIYIYQINQQQPKFFSPKLMAKAKAKSKKSWKTPQKFKQSGQHNSKTHSKVFGILFHWLITGIYFSKFWKKKTTELAPFETYTHIQNWKKNTHIHIPTLSKEKHGNFKILLVLSCNLKLLLLCTNIQFYN